MSMFMYSKTYFFKPKIVNFIPLRSIKAKVPNTFVNEVDKDGFRILELFPTKIKKTVKYQKSIPIFTGREQKMPVDQDWPTVWPSQKTFQPHSVPLPVRQGYPKPGEGPFSKIANTELMKIPNFLHLTPPAIKRHCEALKQFCTEWPKELDSDAKCTEHFPLEVLYSDYCYSGPSIRDPLSRIITFKVKLSSLKLDYHAKDKILRLAGNRYDYTSDIITIITDRCPMRKQNYDYATYLLIALYHESWRKEDWENEKALADMEYYDWEKNQSKKNLVTIYAWPEIPQDFNYAHIPHAEEYKVAVSELINNGEDEHSINKYKQVVKKLMFFKPEKNHSTESE
ncbi:PREDICTED: 28S ribosomal protein S35, mitochondrial [Ceratosolen solmsi marchali]|uniref:28S ribosomal protein S35, mitochondrial n=1 Tax=Ceratosolen solmsi marchali TaxID=326594 RepID=A0AAJ6YNN6_9HYME|nr:PREDICTED: 28S ribosomal protein S35, mitochondrial [Ceratosolen solmsi marchali]